MTATPIAGMSVGATINLAEAALAVPRLVRSGTIGRAAAITLLAIASEGASSPDRICECSQSKLADLSSTRQPYLASVCLPQLLGAGLVAQGRDGRRAVYTVDWAAVRAAAAEGGGWL